MTAASGERAVARHHAEVLGAMFVAEKFHRKGNAGVLAVAIIGGGGAKVTIRNGSLIDVGAEELVGAFDRLIDLGVLDAEFLCQGDEEEAAITGSIERAVSGIHAVELTAVKRRKGKGVAPASTTTLTHGSVNGVFLYGRQYKFIPSSLVVEGAVQTGVSMVPALHALVGLGPPLKHFACGNCRRVPLSGVFTAHPVVYDFPVLRLTRCDQRNRF